MKHRKSFTEADQFLLEISEKRFAIEEDVNKTLQQKAPLVLATVGFFSAFLGQFFLQLLGQWAGHCTQWIALSLVASALASFFAAATCLLPALFGTYSVPALPRMWHDHLNETKAALQADKDDDLALSHLKRGYLDALIEATDKACAANAAKTSWIERARRLLVLAVPLAALAVVSFSVQAISRPNNEEARMSDDGPAATTSQSAPTEAVSVTPEVSPAPASSSDELPARPPNQTMTKSADTLSSAHVGEFFSGIRRG